MSSPTEPTEQAVCCGRDPIAHAGRPESPTHWRTQPGAVARQALVAQRYAETGLYL